MSRRPRSNVLIGLNGEKESGKDTAGNFIIEWAPSIGRDAERDAFADRLKISAAHAFGVMDHEIDFCNALKQEGCEINIEITGDYDRHGYWHEMISGREYLQWYGTEAHRDVFDPDFWVDAVLPNPDLPYCGRDETFDILVLTDVRFPNEAARVKECGGEVWEIVRPSQSGGDKHASEQSLPPELVDRRIYNESTLEAFQNEVITLAERSLYVTV